MGSDCRKYDLSEEEWQRRREGTYGEKQERMVRDSVADSWVYGQTQSRWVNEEEKDMKKYTKDADLRDVLRPRLHICTIEMKDAEYVRLENRTRGCTNHFKCAGDVMINSRDGISYGVLANRHHDFTKLWPDCTNSQVKEFSSYLCQTWMPEYWVEAGAGPGQACYTVFLKGIPNFMTIREVISFCKYYGTVIGFQMLWLTTTLNKRTGDWEFSTSGVALVKYLTVEDAARAYNDTRGGVQVGSYHSKMHLDKSNREMLIPTRRSGSGDWVHQCGPLFGSELLDGNLKYKWLDDKLWVHNKFTSGANNSRDSR